MNKTFLKLGAFFGATGVALGALGAHYLKGKLQAGVIDRFQYEAFDKGTKYQLFHALALLFVFLISKEWRGKLINATAWLFTAGILFFSGSIYFLSTKSITQINFSWLGPITPLGGILLISGWVCLLLSAFKTK